MEYSVAVVYMNNLFMYESENERLVLLAEGTDGFIGEKKLSGWINAQS